MIALVEKLTNHESYYNSSGVMANHPTLLQHSTQNRIPQFPGGAEGKV